MSWRNLLQWKKQKIIKDDVNSNFIRLMHTIEKQIFDKNMYKPKLNKRKAVIKNEVEL